jgi:hypothetical protein
MTEFLEWERFKKTKKKIKVVMGICRLCDVVVLLADNGRHPRHKQFQDREGEWSAI